MGRKKSVLCLRDLFGRESVEVEDPAWQVAIICTSLLVVGLFMLLAGVTTLLWWH